MRGAIDKIHHAGRGLNRQRVLRVAGLWRDQPSHIAHQLQLFFGGVGQKHSQQILDRDDANL